MRRKEAINLRKPDIARQSHRRNSNFENVIYEMLPSRGLSAPIDFIQYERKFVNNYYGKIDENTGRGKKLRSLQKHNHFGSILDLLAIISQTTKTELEKTLHKYQQSLSIITADDNSLYENLERILTGERKDLINDIMDLSYPYFPHSIGKLKWLQNWAKLKERRFVQSNDNLNWGEYITLSVGHHKRLFFESGDLPPVGREGMRPYYVYDRKINNDVVTNQPISVTEKINYVDHKLPLANITKKYYPIEDPSFNYSEWSSMTLLCKANNLDRAYVLVRFNVDGSKIITDVFEDRTYDGDNKTLDSTILVP